MILLNRRKYFHRRRPQGAPADLADAVVTLASETVYYTGNPVYPSVSVTYEGAALIVNTDYTLNYTDNTNVGAATVTVTGMGEFVGSVVKTFHIVSAAPSSDTWTFDVADIPDTLTWNNLAAKLSTGELHDICPSVDESKLLVGTGSGLYLRAGSISDFDPYSFSQTEQSSSGKNIWYLHTPDGLHYVANEPASTRSTIRTVTPVDPSNPDESAYVVNLIPNTGETGYTEGYPTSGRYLRGCAIPDDGTKALFSSDYGGFFHINSCEMSTPWDASTFTSRKELDVSYSGPIWVNPLNPRQVLLVDRFGNAIQLITLKTAWDAGEIDKTETKTFASPIVPGGYQMGGVAVSRDGKKIMMSRNDGYVSVIDFSELGAAS